MSEKAPEPEQKGLPDDHESSELDEQEGELLPKREVPSILPTGEEMLRGPFDSP
jgi:hypothetical protein